MATKRAIELGFRLRVAQLEAVRWTTPYLPIQVAGQAKRAIRALELAAIAVGEERERGRQAKRKGPRR